MSRKAISLCTKEMTLLENPAAHKDEQIACKTSSAQHGYEQESTAADMTGKHEGRHAEENPYATIDGISNRCYQELEDKPYCSDLVTSPTSSVSPLAVSDDKKTTTTVLPKRVKALLAFILVALFFLLVMESLSMVAIGRKFSKFKIYRAASERDYNLLANQLEDLLASLNQTNNSDYKPLDAFSNEIQMTAKKIDLLAVQVTLLEKRISSAGSAIVNLEESSNVSCAMLTSTIRVLEENLSSHHITVERDINSIRSSVRNLNHTQGLFESELSHIAHKLGTIGEMQASFKLNASALKEDISLVQTSFSRVERNISDQHLVQVSLLERASDAETNISSLTRMQALLTLRGTDLTGKVRMLKEGYNDLQIKSSSIEENITNITQVQSVMMARNSDFETSLDSLNLTQKTLTTTAIQLQTNISTLSTVQESIVSWTTSLTGSIESLYTRQTAVGNALSGIQLSLNSTRTKLNTTTSQLNNLTVQLNSSVNVFGGCRKDNSSCEIHQHSRNTYWYLCTTPYRAIEVDGYFTLSVGCQRDPDAIYLDSAFLEVSHTNIRCHCNVVGLTTSGRHEGLFILAPVGRCYLVITRCPTVQSIL